MSDSDRTQVGAVRRISDALRSSDLRSFSRPKNSHCAASTGSAANSKLSTEATHFAR